MENLTQRWTQSGPFFQNQGTFFDFYKKGSEGFLPPPCCVPLSVTEYASISLNIPKYPWNCLNNLFSLCQGSEYDWSSYMFDRLLKMTRVWNMSGFLIWRCCICKRYTKFWVCLNMAQYAWMSHYALMPSICLNITE